MSAEGQLSHSHRQNAISPPSEDKICLTAIPNFGHTKPPPPPRLVATSGQKPPATIRKPPRTFVVRVHRKGPPPSPNWVQRPFPTGGRCTFECQFESLLRCEHPIPAGCVCVPGCGGTSRSAHTTAPVTCILHAFCCTAGQCSVCVALAAQIPVFSVGNSRFLISLQGDFGNTAVASAPCRRSSCRIPPVGGGCMRACTPLLLLAVL